MNRISNRRGFTMMELMVTVGIFTLVAAIAIPNMISWRTKRQLDAGSRELYGFLQSAKLTAIKDNVKVVVTFDPDNDNNLDKDYIAFVDDGAGAATLWTHEAGEPIVGRGRLPEGISFVSVELSGTNKQMYFGNRGIPVRFGEIRLKNDVPQYRGVAVSRMGHLGMIRSTNGTDWQ